MKLRIFFFLLILFSKNNFLMANTQFYQEGLNLFKKEKFKEAKFKFEQDIVFNPKNEMSYLYLAKIFKHQKDDFMEEQNLNTVILLNPKNEEALYLLALLNIKKSDYDKSEKLISDLKKVCSNFCEKEDELKKKLENLEPKK